MATTIETIYTIWLRELTRFIRSKSRMIGSGGQPLIWIAIFGVGLASAFPLVAGSVSYLAYIALGVIGMTILFTSVFAGVSVIWDKQFGFLKEILVAPVSRVGIVMGKIAGSATIAVLSALIILIIVVVVGIVPLSALSTGGLLESIGFMILVSMIFVSIGLIIAANINNIEGFQVIVNFLLMPLFFLSGAVFPLTNAPLWMKGLSYIDPLTYSIDGMRGALLHASAFPLWMDALIVIVVTVFLVGVADYSFRKIQGAGK